MLEDNPDAVLLWSRQELYAFTSSTMPSLLGTANNLFIIGVDVRSRKSKLYSIDSMTGEVIWEWRIHLPSPIAASRETLYQGDYNTIRAYDIRNGSLLWEAGLNRAGNIMFLSASPEKICVYGSSGKSFTLDDQGHVIKETEVDQIRFTLICDDITVVSRGYRLEGINNQSGDLLWSTELDDSLGQAPLFWDSMIYIRTGIQEVPGKIIAISRLDGHIAWESERNAISNPGVLDSYLFYLGMEGDLILLDRMSGLERFRLKFSPRPFVIDDSNGNTGGYYVAADPENRIIFVSLGDSYQVFAIKLLK
jgi:outer membrane protein assembly factor BamB